MQQIKPQPPSTIPPANTTLRRLRHCPRGGWWPKTPRKLRDRIGIGQTRGTLISWTPWKLLLFSPCSKITDVILRLSTVTCPIHRSRRRIWVGNGEDGTPPQVIIKYIHTHIYLHNLILRSCLINVNHYWGQTLKKIIRKLWYLYFLLLFWS